MSGRSRIRFSAVVVAIGLSVAFGPVVAATAAPSGGAAATQVAAVALPATANTPCTTAKSFGSGQWMRVVPTTAGGSRDCYLVQGNYGNGVKALQRGLVYCEGYSVGSSGIDGSFGPATRNALWTFQSDYGLIADGQYGNQTHNFMYFRSNTSGTVWFCNRDSAI